MLKSIIISGVRYDIIEIETVDNDPTVMGLCVYADSVIYIKKALSKDRKNQTLIHEVMHAMFYEAGFDEQDEDEVNRLGKVLFQVLKENDLEVS
ncbi:hypothetical protein [Enterococcus sp. CSURQ0835]|uniref:hypothetical protein n=1 Tax=Enterococcus sp. CSURQ0835 TaxID=2681394 RepID=UPI00135B1346|nr:hypothetical protein [Enterococcus sp. CSURQ0835]